MFINYYSFLDLSEFFCIDVVPLLEALYNSFLVWPVLMDAYSKQNPEKRLGIVHERMWLII